MKSIITAVFIGISLCINAANAEVVKNKDGRPTSKIFIFATQHLHSMKNKHDLNVLEGVLRKLKAVKPDLIAIEVLPPYEIAAMRMLGVGSKKTLNKYARLQLAFGKIAQKKLGMSWEEAYNLIADPNVDCPKGYDYEKCIFLYLAAYDYYTAYLKWTSSGHSMQAHFKSKHEMLYRSFVKKSFSTNEYISIASKLAEMLGQKRLHPVDSHIEKLRNDPYFASLDGGKKSLLELRKGSEKHPFFLEMNSQFEKAANRGDLLPYYRWVNAPETGKRDEAFQWHQLLINDNKNKIGASFVAMWEIRNLRMASHLTRIMAENPGKTMLYIVGAGHKPILDRYFSGMNWVEVLDSKDVLGTKEP